MFSVLNTKTKIIRYVYTLTNLNKIYIYVIINIKI